eukprot:8712179-Pyramimonas_sp.AAC.1
MFMKLDQQGRARCLSKSFEPPCARAGGGGTVRVQKGRAGHSGFVRGSENGVVCRNGPRSGGESD